MNSVAHIIPDGWRILGYDERIEAGDRIKYIGRIDVPTYHPDIEEWEEVVSTIGQTPGMSSYSIWIRKGEAMKDREWVNSWD